MKIVLHFTPEELAQRRSLITAELIRRNLDGLLMFRQESMYYLTGYDTFGYVGFQCLYMGADGEALTLLTRTPDLRQARHTSIIEDVRIWLDAEGADPTRELREILEEHGCRSKRLGLETDAYGLTGFNLKRLEAALEGFCDVVESSDLVTRQRAVKSPAEISYVREAARLADLALDRAIERVVPGAFEGDILATLQGTIFEGGGDFPAHEAIIGSGPRALLFRYAAGMRSLDSVDQLSLEWAGSYRRYHAAMMRTILIGEVSDYQRRLFDVTYQATEAMTEALAPGRPVDEVAKAHSKTLDSAGLKQYRFASCGYSLGATFSPKWMDWPGLYEGNTVLAEPGMVFFLHCIVADSDRGIAMSLGRTSLVTEAGREVLSQRPLELIIVY